MEVGVSRRGRHKALGLLIAAEVGTVCKSVLIRGQVGGGDWDASCLSGSSRCTWERFPTPVKPEASGERGSSTAERPATHRGGALSTQTEAGDDGRRSRQALCLHSFSLW